MSCIFIIVNIRPGVALQPVSIVSACHLSDVAVLPGSPFTTLTDKWQIQNNWLKKWRLEKMVWPNKRCVSKSGAYLKDLSADSPDNVRDSECYNFLSGLLLTVLIFRMKCICLKIIVSVQAWLNYVTWYGVDTSANCHVTDKSHDMPDENSIGSIPNATDNSRTRN